MRESTRRSVPAKIVALSFIVLTLAGNFWIVRHLTGSALPYWFDYIILAGVAGVLTGGAGLGVVGLMGERQKRDEEECLSNDQERP